MHGPVGKPVLQKNITLKLKWLILSIVLLFSGCGGGGGTDITPPVVSITSPTGNPTYSAAITPLTIAGSASDNRTVSMVTWSSSTGSAGTCTGTTSWTAAVPLTRGLNTITVTAYDRAGNTSIATLAVTYNPVTLSGTVRVPLNTAVDSDVNDPNQTYISNDNIATAQPIPNPVTIGGYVNVPGAGVIGRSYNNPGDIDDYFSVSLSRDDSLFLSISDYTAGSMDLELYIYNEAGAVVASSIDGGNSRSISNFPYTGTYYVNVHAVSGASNYILSLGVQNTNAALNNLSTDSEFMPGQAIVRMKDQGIAITSVQDVSARAFAMGMNLKAGGAGRETLLSFDENNKVAAFRALGVPDNRISLKAVDEDTQKKLDTLLAIKALRKRSDIELAEPNFILHAAIDPDDTYYNLQWNLPLINLPQAWNATKGSNTVIVAVVDTGVLLSHPDLSGKLTTTGYDFISDPTMANDNNGIDSNPDDPGDKANSGSSSFHGTHVAGIVGAATNNSLGVAGVGWNTLVMPVRVLGVGGGTEYDILQGVQYAAGLPNDSGTVPAKKADIINLSLGGGSYSSAAQAVFTNVRNAGVIVIAAAGNSNSSTPFYPASYDGVVSVSAVNINGTRASYSNYGSNIDVAAPGGDDGDLNGDGYPDYVPSTCGDDSSGTIKFTYTLMAGTSMAAPHVSGVVALMKAVRPSLTPVDLDAFLISGNIVDDIGNPGWDQYYGWGLIDAYRAVHAAIGGTVPTVLKVSPASLNFGQASSTATLTASMIGSGTLDVTSVAANVAWLTITPSSGQGTYIVQLNRSVLMDGNYSASITFTSSSNTVVVPVQMQVNTSGETPDAGFHYVLLVDTVTQDTIAVENVPVVDGTYSYLFNNVAQGTYEIYAGSDRDNDGYIGDAGEAIGAYPSLDQPADIFADTNMNGLDFSTGYLVSLPAAAGNNGDSGSLFSRRIEKVTNPVKLLSP